MLFQALALPFLCMALLVCADGFRWPDEDAVRSINNSLLRAEDAQRDVALGDDSDV